MVTIGGARLAPRVLEGQSFPLGATWDGLGVNFALFSANATKVHLCLFDLQGKRELERIALPEYTDEIWHGYLPDARPGTVYAYRVEGPYEPSAGHRFNSNKLLLDPYAKALVGRLRWSDTHFGYRLGSPRGDLSFDRRDSAAGMLKCQVQDPAFTWGRDRPSRTPWERLIIYETHVGGYTRRHPAVPPALRGTFGGLAHKEVLAYLRALGVTAVELLPVHAFVDDRTLVEKGLKNYWGYNTISFLAPDPRYMATPFVNEFKEMVSRLHDAGIEVILDVVYNHTAEGNEWGPTLSMKGIDNASYYRLLPDNPRHYINDTGTGNTLNVAHPRVLQLVTDSLRYWATEMRVDGFRFDLATSLGREWHGFDQSGGFLSACRQDPILSGLKLIAEPWDIGPGGYQVGQFLPGWAEWNDRYRDCARGYWRGDDAKLPELATRITGSADLFAKRGRRPWASVNFITAHDGFTLDDLVSYNGKHNDANREDNRDGTDNNVSWNCGAEGPTEDPAINVLRERQKRNMLATLLLSQGTPMLLAGDEIANSQQGNNNAYCQDNEIGWLDWEGVGEDGRALAAFVQKLIALRKAHPVFSRGRFSNGALAANGDVKEILWFTPAGTMMTRENWGDGLAKALGVVLDGRAGQTPPDQPPDTATLLLIFNAHHEVVEFTLPELANAKGWVRVIDTTDAQTPEAPFPLGHRYPVTGRCLCFFQLIADQPAPLAPTGPPPPGNPLAARRGTG